MTTTVTTADDLRANLIGAWTLQSYVSMTIDGSDVVYPLGVDAHAGPYTIVDDGLIAHHAEVSLRRGCIGGIQYREAHVHDGTLQLGPAPPILLHGELRDAKLVWRRT